VRLKATLSGKAKCRTFAGGEWARVRVILMWFPRFGWLGACHDLPATRPPPQQCVRLTPLVHVNLPFKYDSLGIPNGYNKSPNAIQVRYIDQDNYTVCTQLGRLKFGEIYKASVQCRADMDTKCKIVLGDLPFNDNPGDENALSSERLSSTNWQELSVCLDKPLTKDEQMAVWLYAEKYETPVFYDDLKVEKVEKC
jgi:hypothetical protein